MYTHNYLPAHLVLKYVEERAEERRRAAEHYRSRRDARRARPPSAVRRGLAAMLVRMAARLTHEPVIAIPTRSDAT